MLKLLFGGLFMGLIKRSRDNGSVETCIENVPDADLWLSFIILFSRPSQSWNSPADVGRIFQA